MNLPVEVEVSGQGPHYVAVEYEWIDTDGAQLLVPPDSTMRLKIIVSVMNDCAAQ